jgi:hypothetical protein
LSLHEVKELAGHASIETTERFYLAVRKDVLDRARAASEAFRKGQFVARLLRPSSKSSEDAKNLEHKSHVELDLEIKGPITHVKG